MGDVGLSFPSSSPSFFVGDEGGSISQFQEDSWPSPPSPFDNERVDDVGVSLPSSPFSFVVNEGGSFSQLEEFSLTPSPFVVDEGGLSSSFQEVGEEIGRGEEVPLSPSPFSFVEGGLSSSFQEVGEEIGRGEGVDDFCLSSPSSFAREEKEFWREIRGEMRNEREENPFFPPLKRRRL